MTTQDTNKTRERLVGIFKGEEFYPAQGLYKSIPYKICETESGFILFKMSIGIGIGICSTQIGVFDSEWAGVYEQ